MSATQGGIGPAHAPLSHAGVRRFLDLGIRLTFPPHDGGRVARAIGEILDANTQVSARLAGLGSAGPNATLTLSITLGSLDDVSAGTPSVRGVVTCLRDLVARCGPWCPALCELPDPRSEEAQAAMAALAGPPHTESMGIMSALDVFASSVH